MIVAITDDMIGHKLGEFAHTRKDFSFRSVHRLLAHIVGGPHSGSPFVSRLQRELGIADRMLTDAISRPPLVSQADEEQRIVNQAGNRMEMSLTNQSLRLWTPPCPAYASCQPSRVPVCALCTSHMPLDCSDPFGSAAVEAGGTVPRDRATIRPVLATNRRANDALCAGDCTDDECPERLLRYASQDFIPAKVRYREQRLVVCRGVWTIPPSSRSRSKIEG